MDHLYQAINFQNMNLDDRQLPSNSSFRSIDDLESCSGRLPIYDSSSKARKRYLNPENIAKMNLKRKLRKPGSQFVKDGAPQTLRLSQNFNPSAIKVEPGLTHSDPNTFRKIQQRKQVSLKGTESHYQSTSLNQTPASLSWKKPRPEIDLSPELKKVIQTSHFHAKTLIAKPKIKISKQLLPFYAGGKQKLMETNWLVQNRKITDANLIEPGQVLEALSKQKAIQESAEEEIEDLNTSIQQADMKSRNGVHKINDPKRLGSDLLDQTSGEAIYLDPESVIKKKKNLPSSPTEANSPSKYKTLSQNLMQRKASGIVAIRAAKAASFLAKKKNKARLEEERLITPVTPTSGFSPKSMMPGDSSTVSSRRNQQNLLSREDLLKIDTIYENEPNPLEINDSEIMMARTSQRMKEADINENQGTDARKFTASLQQQQIQSFLVSRTQTTSHSPKVASRYVTTASARRQHLVTTTGGINNPQVLTTTMSPPAELFSSYDTGNSKYPQRAIWNFSARNSPRRPGQPAFKHELSQALLNQKKRQRLALSPRPQQPSQIPAPLGRSGPVIGSPRSPQTGRSVEFQAFPYLKKTHATFERTQKISDRQNLQRVLSMTHAQNSIQSSYYGSPRSQGSFSPARASNLSPDLGDLTSEEALNRALLENEVKKIHSSDVATNRLVNAVKRLEMTETARIHLAMKIQKKHEQISNENDQAQDFIKSIPKLTRREEKHVTLLAAQKSNQRERYLLRLQQRKNCIFDFYHAKYKVDRHCSKEASKKRMLGRSEESMGQLKQWQARQRLKLKKVIN